MIILVTGGAGYIGSHSVTKLLADNHKIVIYDDLSTGSGDACQKDVKLIIGDVLDKELLNKTIKENKIEAVIHFAGKIKVSESFEIPLRYYETNLVGTLRVLTACVENSVNKFIFSSTAAVYGDVSNSPVAESSLLNPMNPYGKSKKMAEDLIRDIGEIYGLKYFILRYFNVAGASMDGSNGPRTRGMTQLVQVATETATGRRKVLEIYGNDYPTRDGSCIRDYIHVEDLASAHVSALKYLSVTGKSEIMNVGYGHGYSVKEVISVMKGVSGIDFPVVYGGRRVGDPAEVIADNRKILKLTDWRPVYDDLKLICESAYNWETR